jgi:hypothetical protein
MALLSHGYRFFEVPNSVGMLDLTLKVYTDSKGVLALINERPWKQIVYI